MPQLEDLKLSQANAEAIIEKAIEHGAYDSEMPDSKKEKVAAAEEIIAFAVDAWINDNIRPDDEDAEVAASGEQLADLMELAGVDIDDDNNVTYLDPPEADNGGDDEAEGDEAPFDPNDYIEGYTDLSVVTKLKKVKGLDADDEDEADILDAIAQWEEAQDKPSSRVLSYIDEVLGEEAEGEAEAEAEEDEAEDGEEELGEPWEGYDKASAVDIKKVLGEAADDAESPLTAEQVEYVLEYESSREKPAPRKRVIDYCKALLEEFSGGSSDDDPEDEAEPEKPKRGRGRPKKAEAAASSNGSITLTREQILEALAEGEVSVKLA